MTETHENRWTDVLCAAQQDDLPKPDQPESDTEPADEQTAQVPVAA